MTQADYDEVSRKAMELFDFGQVMSLVFRFICFFLLGFLSCLSSIAVTASLLTLIC